MSRSSLLSSVRLTRVVVFSQEATQQKVGLPLRTTEVHDVNVMGPNRRLRLTYEDVTPLRPGTIRLEHGRPRG